MGRSTAKAGARPERPERQGRKALPGRRALLLCLLAALAVAASFALAGCKYSDVLTQHTEDPDLGELDENADPTYVPNPDAELDMDMANLSVDDVDELDTQVAVLPHYDPDAPDNGPTKQLKKSTETPHDEEASEGEESEEEADRDGTGTDKNAKDSGKDSDDEEDDDEGGGDNDSDDDQDDEGDNNNDNENQTSDNTLEDDDSNDQTDSEQGGGGGDTVVVDSEDGTNDDTAKGTVAAVGEYATITQMLGGAGALAACDQSWLDSCKANGCFSSKGDELERVTVAFSGDGTAAGSCDVNALVNTIQPSVVLWDSSANEPALTEAERSTLEAAGITVQPVPHLGEQTTEDYEVKAAVAEVASVLSGASGLQYDPAGVLSQYNEFHDKALKACYDDNSGYSYKVTDDTFKYLYQVTPLSGLDDSTTERAVTVYVDDLLKSGVSSTSLDQSEGGRTLANDGVTLDLKDGVGLSATAKSGGYALVDYYLQLAGVVNNAYDMSQLQSKRYILMPGIAASFSSTGNYAKRSTSSAFFFNAGDGTVASNWHALGDNDFNTVLVANSDIQSAFVKSAAKSNGLYHMEGSYRVLVVPTGIAGAWTEGHLDSFLMAPWSFRLQNEKNLESAASYAEGFYSTFLRCGDWSSAVSDWSNVQTAG